MKIKYPKLENRHWKKVKFVISALTKGEREANIVVKQMQYDRLYRKIGKSRVGCAIRTWIH